MSEAGSPTQLSAADRHPCLVVIHGDDLGKKYNLNASDILIGRSAKCDIRINQESMSRNHSKIISDGKAVLIRDLGSSNGTYVNDEPIEEHVLRDGDLIKVGRTILKFLGAENIEISYHEEMYRLRGPVPVAVTAAGPSSLTRPLPPR